MSGEENTAEHGNEPLRNGAADAEFTEPAAEQVATEIHTDGTMQQEKEENADPGVDTGQLPPEEAVDLTISAIEAAEPVTLTDLEPLPLQPEDVAMLIDAMPQPQTDALVAEIVPLGTDADALAVDSLNFALPPPSTPQPILPLQPHDSITPLALNNNSIPGSVHDPMMSTPFVSSPMPILEPEAPRIQAFAKLEFDDGQFYMNTYSVVLGRDLRAARMAHQQAKSDGENGYTDHGRDQSSGEGEKPKHKRVGSSRFSVVSESGGIIGADDQAPKKRSRKGSRRSKSSDSSSHAPLSRKNSNLPASMLNDYQSMARPSTGGAHPVNPSALLPSPDECPLIQIHPPATGTGSSKGISRKHAKIKYNFETNGFEVEILGKNGVFLDEVWYPAGEVKPLRSGSYIQIGGVGVRFILPDVPTVEGRDVDSSQMDAQDEIFEYEDGETTLIVDDSDLEESDIDNDNDEIDDEDDNEDEEEDDDGGDEGEDDEEEEEDEDEEEAPPVPEPPKKRGPGRPPKNGISRREMAERARAEKQRLTLTLTLPSKNKVGRPRKHPRPEDLPQKTEKRKYTRRNVEEQPERIGKPVSVVKKEQGLTKPKEKRPPKPPRSPSPVFDESKLTPEQLEKPSASYVVLIYEAISNSKTGAMSLPQIYRAIERKYPFFKVRVQTNGWQSSVRHNLSQHPAFCKVERDGKGWMWGLVPDVSVEKERRRKSSPQLPAQPAMQQPYAARNGAYQRPGVPQQVVANRPGAVAVHTAGTGFNAKFVNSPAPANFRSAPLPNPPAPAVRAAPPARSPYASYARPTGATATPGYYPHMRTAQGGQSQPMLARLDANEGLNRELNKSIVAFQTKLTASLTASVPNAKVIVQSGVDRVLGNASRSTVPGGEHSLETNIMTALTTLISQVREKYASQGLKPAEPQNTAPRPVKPAVAAPPPAKPNEPVKATPAAQSQLLNLLTAIGKGRRVGAPPPTSSNGSPAPPSQPAATTAQKRNIDTVDTSSNGDGLRHSKRIALDQTTTKS